MEREFSISYDKSVTTEELNRIIKDSKKNRLKPIIISGVPYFALPLSLHDSIIRQTGGTGIVVSGSQLEKEVFELIENTVKYRESLMDLKHVIEDSQKKKNNFWISGTAFCFYLIIITAVLISFSVIIK